MTEEGYCWAPVDEDQVHWVMVPMADLRPGDLFKFTTFAEIAALGLATNELLPERELDELSARLRDLVTMSPVMRFLEESAPSPDGRARCQATVE